MYKDYILSKSLQKQVSKVETNLITNIAAKVIQSKSKALYGNSLPKCKRNINKVVSELDDNICIFDEINPVKAKGSKFWAELFISHNSMNNTVDS
jgi:hypothetical protein